MTAKKLTKIKPFRYRLTKTMTAIALSIATEFPKALYLAESVALGISVQKSVKQ